MNLSSLLRHMTALPQALRPGHPQTSPRAVVRDLFEQLTMGIADRELLETFSATNLDDARTNYYASMVPAVPDPRITRCFMTLEPRYASCVPCE